MIHQTFENKALFSYNESWNQDKLQRLFQEGLEILEIKSPKSFLPQDLNAIINQDKLVSLSLDGIPINSFNIEPLLRCISSSPLKKLTLSSTRLNNEHLRRLHETIMVHPSLTEVSLQDIGLNASHLPFIKSLLEERNKPLCKLDIKRNQFDKKALLELKSLVLRNDYLTECHLERQQDSSIAKHLKSNVQIQHLCGHTEWVIQNIHDEIDNLTESKLGQYSEVILSNLNKLKQKKSSEVSDICEAKAYSCLALAHLSQANFEGSKKYLQLLSDIPKGGSQRVLTKMQANKLGYFKLFAPEQSNMLKSYPSYSIKREDLEPVLHHPSKKKRSIKPSSKNTIIPR